MIIVMLNKQDQKNSHFEYPYLIYGNNGETKIEYIMMVNGYINIFHLRVIQLQRNQINFNLRCIYLFFCTANTVDDLIQPSYLDDINIKNRRK